MIRRNLAGVIALLTLGLLTACGAGRGTEEPDAPVPSAPGSTAEAFPRTIDIPASDSRPADSVTLDEEPLRVAALTYETAELVAALGAGDRLVMVPEAVTNPVLTNHHDVMTGVGTTVASESTTNAEAVIQSTPDLVLLSARHGLEDGVGRVLTDAGFPVIVLPNSWADVDDMLLNVRIVGEALGVEDAAEDLGSTISAGLQQRELDDPAPSVLVLGNQAGQPFVTAGAAFPLEVLRLSGATDAGAALGFETTGPITAEQVVQAAPDAILMIDMNGTGERFFASLMENPAVASLPAVAEDKVMLVEGHQIQALGLDHTAEGLELLHDWLEQP